MIKAHNAAVARCVAAGPRGILPRICVAAGPGDILLNICVVPRPGDTLPRICLHVLMLRLVVPPTSPRCASRSASSTSRSQSKAWRTSCWATWSGKSALTWRRPRIGWSYLSGVACRKLKGQALCQIPAAAARGVLTTDCTSVPTCLHSWTCFRFSAPEPADSCRMHLQPLHLWTCSCPLLTTACMQQRQSLHATADNAACS